MLSDALASSPILRAEDGTALAPVGTGFEFGIDPSEDPELAMVSYLYQDRERWECLHSGHAGVDKYCIWCVHY